MFLILVEAPDLGRTSLEPPSSLCEASNSIDYVLGGQIFVRLSVLSGGNPQTRKLLRSKFSEPTELREV
jgi:hypothetical protein